MPKHMPMLVVFFVATAAAAVTGAQFMPGAWHAALVKPPWNPPNWVFGPVWTTLYIMIAIAGWLAWRAEGLGRAVWIWIAALVLNGLWTVIFFGQQRIGLALVDIAVLLGLIGAFIAATWRPERRAALLFVPYFAWVAFATALNAAIWVLNP